MSATNALLKSEGSLPGADLRLSRPLLSIHRAMTLDEFWGGLCGVLTSVLPSHSISVYLNYFNIGRDFRALHRQCLPGCHQPWEERRKVSPTPDYLRSHVGKKIFSLKELIPDSTALPHTNYFKRVMAAEGWQSQLCLTYWRQKEPTAMVVIRKAPPQGDFSTQEYELLEILYEHFDTALRRIEQRQDEQAAQYCLAQCLPYFPLGVLVLDPELRPVFKNQEAMLACLRWNRGSDAVRRYDPAKAFEVPREIAEACAELVRRWDAPSDRPDGLGDSETLVLRNPAMPKHKFSVRLLRPRDYCLAKPCFLVQIANGERGCLTPLELSGEGLLLLQRLTPREQEVALAAAEGLSNIEIALRLGKTEATVKAQLFSVFQKLGVQRRSQLTAALR